MSSGTASRRCHRLKSVIGDIYVHTLGGAPVRIGFDPPVKEAGGEEAPPSLEAKRLMHALTELLDGKDVDRGLAERLLASAGLTEFQWRVYRVVLSIPRGSTLSYGEVAELAGSPRAARAVGNAMRRNPFPLIVPCHRVVRSDGSPGGYAGPRGMKERLLKMEGTM